MKGRGLIKSQILEAWLACIQTDYVRQRINSERSLQASFWAQLNGLLDENRRLFIEPRMALDDGTRVYPDIVVCNTRQVIAVVELKYLPRTRPEYAKDIRTLDLIASHRSAIWISNARFRGQASDEREYGVANKVLFVWAGVHAAGRKGEDQLFSDGYETLQGCYLQLHAATRPDEEPSIYWYE